MSDHRTKGRKATMTRPGTDGQAALPRSGGHGFPLNATGRATAEGFLAKYKGWPAACLCTRNPATKQRRLYAVAQEVLGEDELHAVACGAVVRAAANYDPEAHGCAADKYTYVVNGVYLTVQRAVQEAIARRERQAALFADRREESVLDDVPGREADPAEAVGGREAVAAMLARCGAALDFREWQAVACKYKLGLGYTAVGVVIGGVTRERARQVVNGALAKMRAAVQTPETPGDGTPDPAPRSHPCPRRNRVAASR